MTPWPAVAPNREISTRLRLGHLVKASFSGCAEVIPAVLICVKIGDSFILKRTYREMLTRMSEARKGMRHPQLEKSSLDMDCWVSRMTMSETKRPSVAVIWMKLV